MIVRFCGGASIMRKSNISVSYKEATHYRNPSGYVSFKDAMQGEVHIPSYQIKIKPRPYIVEQMEWAPTMEVNHSEVNSFFFF